MQTKALLRVMAHRYCGAQTGYTAYKYGRTTAEPVRVCRSGQRQITNVVLVRLITPRGQLSNDAQVSQNTQKEPLTRTIR